MQNQMNNQIQSGINEREYIISELDNWQNIAKEQLQLLKMIENKIKIIIFIFKQEIVILLIRKK